MVDVGDYREIADEPGISAHFFVRLPSKVMSAKCFTHSGILSGAAHTKPDGSIV